MLRKRTRSHHKDQPMNHLISDAISEFYFCSDISSQKQKTNSFLKMPGLFVGFNPRSPDADSARSPTSPLDFRIFSSFGNPFRHPRSPNEGQLQKSWNCSKVGLSIIDSLGDDETKEPGKVIRSSDKKNDFRLSDKKNILLERQMSVRSLDFCSHVNYLEVPKKDAFFPKPASARKGSCDVLFEIGKPLFERDPNENIRARSMDSGKYGSYLTNFGNRKSRFGSGNSVLENTKNPMASESGTSYIGPVPVSEIEDSEDYTCVRIHGPNPKVTHIFGDRILECHNDRVTGFLKKIEDGGKTLEAGEPSSEVLAPYPPNSFLKFCDSCKKELDGEDIYMYRGEKAFCSLTCRSQEIENEEEMEETNNGSFENSDNSSNSSKITSKSGLFIAT